PWPCTRPLGGPRRHPGAAPPSITRRCGPVKPPASRSGPPRRGPRSAWPLQTRQRGAPGRDGARGQRRRRKCCGGVPAGDLLGLCLPEMRNVHAGRRCPAWASCITEKFTGSIHFIHERGIGPRPMPLVMTYGWPSCFVEMTKILPLLTDPGRRGGDPADAFDLVVPSLPGFGFSDHPTERGLDVQRVAGLW